MNQSEINNIQSQMRKGMLEYCVLLKLSHGKYYPSDILNALKDANLIVVEGTLYTLLNRLRREGKLDYEWVESPKGPPRKYFFMTEDGYEVLSIMQQCWLSISTSIQHLSDPKKD
ncbi:MAG: PadR family transcriptional regulator [Muribaculum sp.]|nr:PadR family transcriptional regulator [Muribaculum sp.]